MLAAMSDVIDLAAAEARLKAREQFLALMSHEIRTPLNGVLGMANLLQTTELSPTQRAYVATLKDSGDHLLGLVNDLLDFAKLEAGGIDLEETEVDLERLLQGVCELLSPRAQEKGVEVAWACAPNVPRVVADDGRLRQVLFNLAGNAVKFTDIGGVLLWAEVAGRKGRLRLVLEVRDTGPGIAPDAQTRIFEEFQHARPGDGARHGGAGLGLAIVRRLAEAMSGQVSVAASSAEGSAFRFEIPVSAAAVPAADTRLKGRTIGVASPSRIIREAAQRQVEAAGGAAVCSATLEMTLMTGVAAVLVDGALHADEAPPPPDARALVLLQPGERGRIARYRRTGWAGYLIKPLRRQSLVARVLAAGQSSPAAESHEDERLAQAAAPGTRVLLAEDNPVNALLATAVLSREGCQVDRAASGAEALAALERQAYDLVLMDLRLGDADGREIARAYRASGGLTPMIALTAHAFEEDRRACLEAGMNDFLTKPLEFDALRAVLSRWTQGATPARLAG